MTWEPNQSNYLNDAINFARLLALLGHYSYST